MIKVKVLIAIFLINAGLSSNESFLKAPSLKIQKRQITEILTQTPQLTTPTPSGYIPPSTITTTIPPPIPSTTLQYVNEVPINYQFIYQTFYSDVLKVWSSLTSNDGLKVDITKQLSDFFNSVTTFIQNVDILNNLEGRAVVKFQLISGGIAPTSNKAKADQFYAREQRESLETFKLTLKNNGQTIDLHPLLKYCNWTDNGLCPNVTCTHGTVCTADTMCNLKCSDPITTNNNLYALLVIPILIVIIVIILVLLWYFRYRRPRDKVRIDLNELGYVENRSKFGGSTSRRNDTISGLSLANPGVRNEVFTTMGRSYGFSLENGDFSKPPADDLDVAPTMF